MALGVLDFTMAMDAFVGGDAENGSLLITAHLRSVTFMTVAGLGLGWGFRSGGLIGFDFIGFEERAVHLDAEAGSAGELEGAV
jgi:hypothetical protein